MDRVHLSKLSLPELKVLCRNRSLPTKDAKHELAMKSLLNYHSKYKYRKLKFADRLDDWKKEELIPEAKAVGAASASTFKKSDLAEAIIHGVEHLQSVKSSESQRASNSNSNSNSNRSSSKSKSKSSSNSNRKRPKSASKRSRKKKLEPQIDASLKKSLIAQFTDLEKQMIILFNHLRPGFALFDAEDLPRHHRDWKRPKPPMETLPDNIDDLPSMAAPTRHRVHKYGQCIGAHKFHRTVQKALRMVIDVQNEHSPKSHFFGIRDFKSAKEYEESEVGPFVNVFDDRAKFEKWEDHKERERKASKRDRKRLSGRKRKRAYQETDSNANPKKKAKLNGTETESDDDDADEEEEVDPKGLPPKLDDDEEELRMITR